MTKRTLLIAGLVIVLGLTGGCSPDPEMVIDLSNPRLVPRYICDGDPTPTAAMWTFIGINNAAVEFWNKNGTEKLGGRTNYRSTFCLFTRPLTANDVPIQVRLFHKGELVAEEDMDYTVLSGPQETEDFMGRLYKVESEMTEYVEISRPIFVRCDPGPNGEQANTEKECTDRLDANGDPILDKNGNKVQDCVCPNEGRIIDIVTEQVLVTVPAEQTIVWQVDPTWFSENVETRAYLYKQGGVPLTLSGPGMTGKRLQNVGSGSLGNNENPSGVWIGEVPEGMVISTTASRDEEGNPIPEDAYLLKLTVACADN